MNISIPTPGPSKDYLTATLVTIGCLAVLDALYIGVLARKHWVNQMQQINGVGKHSVRLWAAGIAYAVMIAAILGLVVSRVQKKDSAFIEGLAWGALLGFCAYAIFNFTNLAIFTNYSWQSALIDTSWGTFLMAITGATAAYAATHWFILPPSARV